MVGAPKAQREDVIDDIGRSLALLAARIASEVGVTDGTPPAAVPGWADRTAQRAALSFACVADGLVLGCVEVAIARAGGSAAAWVVARSKRGEWHKHSRQMCVQRTSVFVS